MPDGMVMQRLNIYYLLDTSSSMAGPRIQQLNTCMQELKPVLEETGIKERVEIVVRAIEFGNNNTADWHTGNAANGIPIEQFKWLNLQASGEGTPTSKALEIVADALNPEYLGVRTLRPVIILITDGGCTDPSKVYEEACEKVKKRIGGVETRIAIGVTGFNRAQLENFATYGKIEGIGDKVPFIFEAKDPGQMAAIIRWASVTSIRNSMRTNVGGNDGRDDVIALPPPPDKKWI